MACSAAPLALADARAKYEGSRVLKRFGEELYGGVCDEVWADDDDGGALVFHVTYDDGDAEDVDADEFAELCERAAERAQKNATMDADKFAELCEDAAEHAQKNDAAEHAQKNERASPPRRCRERSGASGASRASGRSGRRRGRSGRSGTPRSGRPGRSGRRRPPPGPPAAHAGNGTPEFAAKPEDTPPAPGGKQRVAVPRSPAPAAAQRLLVDLSNSSPRKADASDAGPAAAGDLDGADGDGVQEAIDGTAGDTETPPKRPRRQAAARGLSQAALREAQAAQIEEMLEDEKSHKRRRLAAVGNGVGGQRSGSGDDDDSDSSSDEDDIVILDDSDAPEAEEQEYSYTQDAYLNPGKSRHVPFPPWSTSAAASMPRPRMPLLAHERRAAHARGELPQQAQGSHWDGATKDVRVWLPVHKDVALRHERSCVCCMCLAGTSHGRKNASTRSSSSEAELDELWRDIQRAEREDGAVFVGRKEAEKSGWSEGSGTHWTEHYRMVTRTRFGLEFDSDKDGPHPSVLKLWQNVPTEPKELMGHAVLPPWYIGFREDSAPEQKARRAARAAVARYRELEDDARGMEADRAASHSKKKNALRATAKRPDLKAFNMMREEERCLDNEARVKCAGGGERQFTKVGTLPGVPVGTTCSSRAEAFALGLHCHWLGGMVGGKCKLAQRRQKGQPLVEYLVSITSSGGYEGDEDGGDVMTYTGSGGNDMLHDAKQVSDQTFTNKNAQLASSAELGLPIRVIRKQAAGSGSGQHGLGPTGRKDEYVYDGLYVCTRYVLQYGISGYVECKYRLERLPGQPPIQSGSVHFNAMGGGSSPLPPWMTPDRRAGFTGVWDITLGQGSVHPIPVINEYRHAATPVPVPIFLTAGATHPTNEHQNGFKPWDEGAAVPDNAIGESAFYYAAEPVLAECAKGAVHETPPANLALVQNEKCVPAKLCLWWPRTNTGSSDLW